MSQQPPYGEEPQQPYQQPNQPPYQQQPYNPYGQAYPNPYGQAPQRPNHTTRNVLLIVAAVIILFCGGLFTLGVVFFNNVDDSFDSDYTGSEDDPLTVGEGDGFTIRGFDYDDGWKITADPGGDLAITGLRGTNNRDDEDAEDVYLMFSFYQGNELLASVSCSGAGTVAFGRSVTLDCTDYGDDITGYDEIEVYDTSYYE